MASVEKEYLLTIAIPTYNRSRFLERALHYIDIQIKDKDYPIELIVSDNCSTDDTENIVQRYVDNGLSIRYIKNIENKGPDFNIAQCFTVAQGNYVLILGDDDFLIEGAICKIISILSLESDIGILHIKGKEYDQNNNLIGPCIRNNRYQLYDNQLSFLEKVHYNLTFISGNIFNKLLVSEDLNVKSFDKTYLIQLGWILQIFLLSKKNVYLEDDALGVGSVENTGGYKLFEVFSTNFNKIMNSSELGFENRYINVVNSNLITSFFPGFVYSARKSSENNLLSDVSYTTLNDQYKNSLLYWIYIVPMISLPIGLAKYWLYVLSLINRFKDKVRSMGSNKKKYMVTPINLLE